ncbi:MAG: N-acetylmuramoyl-L-alanine amidase [Actinomycetota bacterium]
MTATLRKGIYLEDNTPLRDRGQFRVGRRSKVRSVIVVHTAESGTDQTGPDPKAENVARFIRDRSDAGSYHLIGDADSIIQLVRFENEAFQDGTGSNEWAIGISLAMNAEDWPTLPAERRSQFVDTAAQMAAIAAGWLTSQGLPAPAPRLLTKAESNNLTASGFISHARRDPTRRSDPGTGFPWDDFFTEYVSLLAPATTPTVDAVTKELQQRLRWAGHHDIEVNGLIDLATVHAAAVELAAARRLIAEIHHLSDLTKEPNP